MFALIRRSLEAARKYTLIDFAVLKILLVSFGILLGAYFPAFFLQHSVILWVVFILAYLLLGYRTFVTHKY